jgi:hypothetical protein
MERATFILNSVGKVSFDKYEGFGLTMWELNLIEKLYKKFRRELRREEKLFYSIDIVQKVIVVLFRE